MNQVDAQKYYIKKFQSTKTLDIKQAADLIAHIGFGWS